MKIECYTGGIAQTNAFLVQTEKSWLAIDAPEGFLDFVSKHTDQLEGLVLTHGHFDHVWDASALVKKYDCPVYYHQADEEMLMSPSKVRDFVEQCFGLSVDLEAIKATKFLSEGEPFECAPWKFQIIHVPGHCPGSVCLYEKSEKLIFGGDVLFAGGIGRTDLPMGSTEELLKGIREKLFVLPGETRVYPGHGPSTTIEAEQKSNPFLAGV